MKKLSILLMFLSLGVFGQIGIGTDNIAPSEALKVENASKGVSIPNIFLKHRYYKPSSSYPPNYLMVYNTNPEIGKGFYYWLNGKWISMLSGNNIYSSSSGKMKIISSLSTETVSFSKALGNVIFHTGDSNDPKQWKQIPGLEKKIDIKGSANKLIFMVDGDAIILNNSQKKENTANYSIGVFIDNKLYAVRSYSIKSFSQCGLGNFTLNTTTKYLSPGEHTVKVMGLLNKKNSNESSLLIGGSSEQCPNITNDMAKASLAIKITQSDMKSSYPPVMGWASWNNYHANISEDIIKKQADYLVSTGLKDAGYQYINIDDGFFDGRDKDGTVGVDKRRFPNGMKVVADYIHSKGLKAGIYSDIGPNTCASIFEEPKELGGIGAGLYKNEEKDLNTYLNDWGYDYIKVDYCSGYYQELKLDEQTYYTQIRDIINKISSKYVNFNACRWEFPGTWITDVGNSWRISQDIQPTFESMMSVIDKNTFLAPYMKPGHYNDMDMLQIGRGMSENEDKAQMSMWAVLTSPLLLGNDLSIMKKKTFDIISNKEVIDVNQDITEQGHLISNYRDPLQVWAKKLNGKQSGEYAIVLFNTSPRSWEISFNFEDLGLYGNVFIRDLWAAKNLGIFKNNYHAEVPSHGVVMLKIRGKYKNPNIYEAEYAFLKNYHHLKDTKLIEGQATPDFKNGASRNAIVRYIGGNKDNYIDFRNVYAEKDGYYNLDIYYYSEDNRMANVYVNDKLITSINFFGIQSRGVATVRVPLKRGENSIKLNNPDAYTADIDKIEINEN